MFESSYKITLRLVVGVCRYSKTVAKPLRSTKPKSTKTEVQTFIDMKHMRAVGGQGGDGCVSFLQLWSNDRAGPDGGDGGNGGHVILEASTDVKHLVNVPSVARAPSGENGRTKDCHGKSADHLILKVPVGTVVKNAKGKVIGDLAQESVSFVAARGGAGGKGNHFFTTETLQAPQIAEIGAYGEDLDYTLEIKSMAHVGLIGFPNAGKSTLLRAISRARPKVAPYAFTTLKPHIGMVQYDDYEQIAVADLPGLIPDSHKNRGLGIQFLRHAERCMALLYILDLSDEEPWNQLETLQFELSQFSRELLTRPQLVVANKMDLPEAEGNLEEMRRRTTLKVLPISAKMGGNILELLNEIRVLYDIDKAKEDGDSGALS